MSKVWLITGSGNGLGRDIAEAALAAGDSVVAGARRTEELAPLVAQYGERVKPVKLEVRDEAAAKAAVELAVDTFMNNAGYGQFAPFEQMSAEDFQAIVDTCFYGVVYTTRAAMPVPRPAKASSFEAQKYTGVTNRIFKPFSTSRSSAWSIAGRYQVFENPRIFASSGITSSVVVFCCQRQSGAPSLVSSSNPSFLSLSENSVYSA